MLLGAISASLFGSNLIFSKICEKHRNAFKQSIWEGSASSKPLIFRTRCSRFSMFFPCLLPNLFFYQKKLIFDSKSRLGGPPRGPPAAQMATRIANRGPKRPPRALPIWSQTHVSTASSNFLGFWEPGASILRARGVPRGRFWEPPGINLVDISNADFLPLRTSFFEAATYITRLRVIPLRLRGVFQTLVLGP